MDITTNKPILLELSNYNIEEAKVALIKKLIADNPKISRSKIGNEMGISERTVYRIMLDKNLLINRKKKPKGIGIKIARAKKYLENNGYAVIEM